METPLPLVYSSLHDTFCPLACSVKHDVNTFNMIMIKSPAEAVTCNTQFHKRLGAIYLLHVDTNHRSNLTTV